MTTFDTTPRPIRRDGFALPLALGVMVAIAGLLAGVFALSLQQSRMGGSSVMQERAFRASEQGLNGTIATWNSGVYSALATGGTATKILDSSAARGYVDTVRVMRLSANLFLVASTAVAGTGPSAVRRRTSATVRLVYPSVSVQSALIARGNIVVSGTTYINGSDSLPYGWGDCPPPSAALPGLMVQGRSSVDLNGCQGLKCIDGNPDIKSSPAAGDTNTFFSYGDMNYASLTATAAATYPADNYTLNGMAPSYTADGTCNAADTFNWGDMQRATPSRGCESYFPVIYFKGSTNSVHITGGQGQGILIVEGDLQISGGFTWSGIVITRGHFESTGTGAHVYGAVLAGNADVESNSLAGNAVINYSSCAVQKATMSAATAKAVTQRSWVDLF